MTQTWAIFYDAYRSLNAKKMFWIVLILSVLVVVAFACVGINERGLKILVWQFDTKPLTTENMEPAVFYKFLFANFGVGIWLAWFATILALVSTAGIFPDLINGGSINLLVSKPIGRLRLFLTQYAAGLLFVTLQVFLFALACFLVIGLRGGAWEPSLFVSVPLVACFFSYMFCVCVLLGLVTRSTLAALLLTLLFWLLTWGVGTTELVLLAIRTEQKHGNFPPGAVQIQPPGDRSAAQPFAGDWPPSRPPKVDPAPTAERPADEDTSLKRGGKVPLAIGRSLLKAIAEPSSPDEKGLAKGPKRIRLEAGKFNPDENTPDADKKAESSAKLKLAHDIAFALKTVLPKTSETIGLLERSLYDMADLPEGALGQPPRQAKSQRELVETVRNRSPWWIVGTSLGFEALVLCLGAFIFCRRDY